jgi:hypothetical protein
MNKIILTTFDKKIILRWYEDYLIHTQHHGNSNIIFPEEQSILQTLNSNNSEIDFTDNQVETIFTWVETAIHQRYGDAKYLLSEEINTYNKIANLYSETTISFKSKNDLDIRLKNVSNKINKMTEVKELLKKRPLDDKIKAVKEMKEELNNHNQKKE